MKARTTILIWFFLVAIACKKEGNEPPNNEEGDLISYPSFFGTPDLPQNLTAQTVDLGRHLFYDPILSSDSTVSCASCHQQKFAFSDNKQFSDGVEGGVTARHSMAIFNTIWQDRFFWDGRASSLEDQALQPIENPDEMNLPINEALVRLNRSSFYKAKFIAAFGSATVTRERLAKALSDFERVLISKNSKYDRSKLGTYTFTASEARGEELFMTHPVPGNLRGANCGDCHAFPHLMDNKFSNNGLDLENANDSGFYSTSGKLVDVGKFKVPNLRNVGFTAPYMHDGRFTTLKEVLDHYNDHVQFDNPTTDALMRNGSNDCVNCQLGLTEQEKADILAFLKTLDDPVFVSNEAFSDPF